MGSQESIWLLRDQQVTEPAAMSDFKHLCLSTQFTSLLAHKQSAEPIVFMVGYHGQYNRLVWANCLISLAKRKWTELKVTLNHKGTVVQMTVSTWRNSTILKVIIVFSVRTLPLYQCPRCWLFNLSLMFALGIISAGLFRSSFWWCWYISVAVHVLLVSDSIGASIYYTLWSFSPSLEHLYIFYYVERFFDFGLKKIWNLNSTCCHKQEVVFSTIYTPI